MQEESGWEEESMKSCSYLPAVEVNNCDPQVIEERFREVVVAEGGNVPTIADRYEMYRIFRSKPKGKNRIAPFIRLSVHLYKMKSSRVLQQQLLSNMNMAAEIASAIHPRANLQLRYQAFNVMAIIIQFFPIYLPLFHYFADHNQRLLEQVIERMLIFPNKRVNRSAILMVYRLLVMRKDVFALFVTRECLFVKMCLLIETKKLQRVKVWMCQIAILLLDVYRQPNFPFRLTDRELQAMMRLVIVMCERKRSSVYVKALIPRLSKYLFGNRMIDETRTELINKMLAVSKIFPVEFMKLANRALAGMRLGIDVVREILGEVDFALHNQEKKGRDLIALILSKLFTYRRQFSVSDWFEVKRMSMCILFQVCGEGLRQRCGRIELYKRMLSQRWELFEENIEFIGIISSCIELQCSNNGKVVEFYRNSIDQKLLEELYERYLDRLRGEATVEQAKQGLRRLVSKLTGAGLQLFKKRYIEDFNPK